MAKQNFFQKMEPPPTKAKSNNSKKKKKGGQGQRPRGAATRPLNARPAQPSGVEQMMAVRNQIEKQKKQRQIFHLQTTLVETPLCTEQFLKEAGQSLLRSHFQDVVLERALIHFCGYPLCGNKIENYQEALSRGKQFKIDAKKKRLYEITELAKFCKEECLIATRFFEAQLPESEDLANYMASSPSPKNINFEIYCPPPAADQSRQSGSTGNKSAEATTTEIAHLTYNAPDNSINNNNSHSPLDSNNNLIRQKNIDEPRKLKRPPPRKKVQFRQTSPSVGSALNSSPPSLEQQKKELAEMMDLLNLVEKRQPASSSESRLEDFSHSNIHNIEGFVARAPKPASATKAGLSSMGGSDDDENEGEDQEEDEESNSDLEEDLDFFADDQLRGEDFGRSQLSEFGTLYTALSGWCTPSTKAYLRNGLIYPAPDPKQETLPPELEAIRKQLIPQPQIPKTSDARKRKDLFKENIERFLTTACKRLSISNRPGIMMQLSELFDSFQFVAALPSFSDEQWEFLCFLFLNLVKAGLSEVAKVLTTTTIDKAVQFYGVGQYEFNLFLDLFLGDSE